MVDGHTCSFRRQPSQDKINAEVEAIVKRFITEEVSKTSEDEKERIADDTATTINGIVSSDMSEQKADLKRLQKQYEQKAVTKDKFFDKMQSLDVSDLNYDRKFDDLQARQDKIYDEMLVLEKQIAELEAVINISEEENQVYENVKQRFYKVMTEGIGFYSDREKKDFFADCIERVDIFEDDKEHGRWVKHIKFKLPIAFEEDGKEVYDCYTDDWCESVNHDETVVQLSK